MARQERQLTAREAWELRQRGERPRPERPFRSAITALARYRRVWSIAGGCLFAVALVTAVFLAYHPIWHGAFIWDDDLHLTMNPVLQPGGWLRTWSPWTHVNYWPVTSTVYRIGYAIWDLDTFGYHMVNIGVHAAAALLVWRLLVRLRVPGAMFAAALFALHPVNVESVAWITQLKNTLSLTLTLLAVICYLLYEEHEGWWRYALALGVFVLATLSKGMTLTLPIVLLACAWWQRGRIVRRDVLRVVPFLLIGLAMAGIEMWLQHTSAGRMNVVVRDDNLLSRAAVAGCAVWFYFWKLIWPVNLLFVYPRWEIDKWNLYSLLPFVPGALLVVLLALGWWKRHTWGRPLLMFMICYVGLLGPALGFANIYFMRFSLVADHWQYAAMIVPCAVFAGLAAAALDRRPWLWLIGGPLGLALLATLTVLTIRQCQIYGNVEQLYRAVIEGNPNCWLAHGNLGQELDAQGRHDDAIAEYKRAIEIYPDCIESLNNLGHTLAVRGQLDEAIAEYKKAIDVNPNNTTIRCNLAVALTGRGRLDEAVDQYRAAYQSARKANPSDLSLCLPLGAALVAAGRSVEANAEYDAAIAEYRKALVKDADNPVIHADLAATLAARGRPDDAIAEFQAACRLAPRDVSFRLPLAAALAARGRLDEAIAEYREILKVVPAFAEVHNNLGNALAAQGSLDEAAEHFRRALQLKSSLVPAQGALDRVVLQRERVVRTLAEWRESLRIHPDNIAGLNDVAWLLATNPTASIRNGPQAVEFAEQAVRLSGRREPAILGTLAAAYAEAGRFSEAVKTARDAAELAARQNKPNLAQSIRAKLSLYEAKNPCRQTPGPLPTPPGP